MRLSPIGTKTMLYYGDLGKKNGAGGDDKHI